MELCNNDDESNNNNNNNVIILYNYQILFVNKDWFMNLSYFQPVIKKEKIKDEVGEASSSSLEAHGEFKTQIKKVKKGKSVWNQNRKH